MYTPGARVTMSIDKKNIFVTGNNVN
jgi:hypothetical protein